MPPDAVPLWVGTYPHPAGAPEGVWSVTLDTATGRLGAPVLRARTPVPSFLAATADGRAVLAAGETSPGALTVLAVEPGPDGARLVERDRVGSGGSSPCHLLLHPAGTAVYVANYASGSVAVVPLVADDGGTRVAAGVAQVFEHSGRGPVADRQEGPHAHATLLTPDGSALLALDIGTDEVRRYRVRPDGLLDADGVAARLAPGTGPRHAAWGPGGRLYVVGELDAALHVLEAAGDGLREVGSEPLRPPGWRGPVLPAHVVADGDRVLVSVRGPDAVLAWDAAGGPATWWALGGTAGTEGTAGARGTAGAERTAGTKGTAAAAWPRHFALVAGARRRWLVVAGERSGRLVALDADDPGAPPASSVAVPSPSCVVPAVPRTA